MHTVYTSFRHLLDELTNSPLVNSHTLGDASFPISYHQLPAYLHTLDQYLQAQGVHADDCIAFECQNTTSALLVLLTLLYRGQHFLLLPAEGSALKEPGFKPNVPAFCKIQITVSDGENEADNLADLVNIYPHTAYQAATWQQLKPTGQRLLLLRTSGSMGDAKIVQWSHADLLGNAANCTQRFEIQPSSRVTIAVPVFHMYGLGAGFVPALLAGASINVQANTNILRFLENERRFHPDIVFLNPTLATMLLKGRRSNHPYARTISAGAALPEQIYQDYSQRFGTLTNLYGSTEMGAAATTVVHLGTDKPSRLLPMRDVQMQIEPNERALHCSHPYSFSGYINSQGEKLPISAQPYNTGDLAQALDDGRIELLGRQSDSTNRAGFLVQFADIENALLRTGDVEQAVVLSGPQETVRGQKLYAFCIAKKPHSGNIEITNQSIRQACFEHLPRYAVPDEIILRESLPLAPSGKINRRLLQQDLSK